MTVSPEELRSVLRQWASGVTVVTAGLDGALHGMTVSSFSSVSLEPPFISVNIERRTRTFSLMWEAGAFAVSILTSDQQAMAQHFGAWFIGSQWQDAIAFVILVLFLLFKPEGFFGKKIKSATV